MPFRESCSRPLAPEQKRAGTFEGETIEIKYLRGNPESVTLARMPAER